MRFLCLICAERVMEHLEKADADKHYADYREFTDELRKNGHLVSCNRLLPPETATTVRVRRDRISTTDGPFTESKELIGGYYVIDARDREEAIQIAARIPGAWIGSVEVRPIAEDDQTVRALGLHTQGPSVSA